MAGKRGIPHQNSDLALSEVVGFILLLGVLVAAIALWMTYVVPINGREEEIIQMNLVKDRFTDYKISLDSLNINGSRYWRWKYPGERIVSADAEPVSLLCGSCCKRQRGYHDHHIQWSCRACFHNV
jgi:hypothetical protein